MKQVILIASVTAMVASSASATLIAAWDFQTTTNGGTAVLAAANTPKTFAANFGSGTLFLDGTNGASDWAQATELNAFGGTALNADIGIGMSTATSGAASLALVNQTANNKSVVFAFNMSSMQNLAISYATQRTSTGFTSQLWEYSTNGTTWSSVGNVTGIQASFTGAAATVTNLFTTGLDNATTAFLRVTFAGANSASGNNRWDNIQFNADPVPAPGALALLSLAGIAGSRRRRA